MTYSVPNIAAAAYAAQSELFSTDFDILVNGMQDTGVVSGLAVTAQGSPNMTVAVAAGVAMTLGTLRSISGTNVTITAADSTNPRIDMIVSNTAGTLSAVAGTPAVSPVAPALTAGYVALAFVYVPAAASAITTAMIIDKRTPVPGFETVRMGKSGTLTTGVGVTPFTAARGRTIVGVYLAANTAPTGAAILVDINKNGTTIFTTQANRPTIAVAAKASTTIAIPDVTAVTALSDLITADIDQVGSTIAGADLTIAIMWR